MTDQRPPPPDPEPPEKGGEDGPGCMYYVTMGVYVHSSQWEALQRGESITLDTRSIEWTQLSPFVGIPFSASPRREEER